MDQPQRLYNGHTAAECVAMRDAILARDAALARADEYRRFKYFMCHASAGFFESQVRVMWAPDYDALFSRYLAELRALPPYQGDAMAPDRRAHARRHGGSIAPSWD